MPDILVQPPARRAPALSATSDMPEEVRKAQQLSDFATAKAPPAQSTTKADTDSSSPAVEEEDALDALDHDTIVTHGERLDAASSKLSQAKPPEFSIPAPRKEDFDDASSYNAALVKWGADKGLGIGLAQIAQQEQKKTADEAFQKMAKAYVARQERAAKRIPDYAKVIAKAETPITDVMARAIVEDPNGPYVEYALNKNPQEAARIAALPPRRQVAEVAKFAATVKPPQQLRASAKAASASKEESMEEYAAKWHKKMQAQRAARYGGVLRK